MLRHVCLASLPEQGVGIYCIEQPQALNGGLRRFLARGDSHAS